MEPWEWLGEPLALDFANTVRRRGLDYEEHLNDDADLAGWARREGIAPPAGELHEIRALRDAVFALLRAATQDTQPPTESLQRVNAALSTLTPQLHETGLVLSGPDHSLARIATSLLEQVRNPALALCDAPGCGQFYLRHRGDQRWCGPSCGTRARVARHSARHARPKSE